LSNPDPRPRWLRELDRLSSIKSQIFLYGNIKDSLLYPVGSESWETGPLREALFSFYKDQGYSLVAAYDVVDGMVFADGNDGTMSKAYMEVVNESKKNLAKPIGPQGRKPNDPLEFMADQARMCLTNRQHPCVFILEYGSQSINIPSQLTMSDRQPLLRLMKSGPESRRVMVPGSTRPLQNLLIVICDKLADLPTWLYLDNPYTGSIEVERPKTPERERFFNLYMKEQGGLKELVELTDGMSYRDLMGVRSIAQKPEAPKDAKKLIDFYKFGVRESLWESLKLSDLSDAEETLSARVIGQPAAVSAVCDMLRRARLSLSGAQHSSRSKPRGVLFFAGPTGVGKTEMAKAIADLVFGSDDACVRFDMSEYGQAHSDQRLLGAPPGYIGYQEGGQLTNRVKSDPFSVLLFDEIEKAHPSILDKFLQILEDGRMTDGRGETVYFGESIIIFTSNVGIYQLDQTTGRPAVDPSTGKPMMNVDPDVDTDYVQLKNKITFGVHAFFKHMLGRPELLNRIGQNIVVFDFVRPPTMKRILENKVLPSITEQIKERWQLDVQFSGTVIDQLMKSAMSDVGSGGRGIGNLVEIAILNPLSRVLFDLMLQGRPITDQRLIVESIEAPCAENAHRYELIWELCSDA